MPSTIFAESSSLDISLGSECLYIARIAKQTSSEQARTSNSLNITKFRIELSQLGAVNVFKKP